MMELVLLWMLIGVVLGSACEAVQLAPRQQAETWGWWAVCVCVTAFAGPLMVIPLWILLRDDELADEERPTLSAWWGLLLVLPLLGGCVSPYKEASGTFLKASTVETRSPFGTNMTYAVIERCKGPQTVVLFYFDADFTECVPVKDFDGWWTLGYSQGQGGQVLSGLMNAAALGGVAAAAGSAGNAVSSASSTVINTVPRGHGHR